MGDSNKGSREQPRADPAFGASWNAIIFAAWVAVSIALSWKPAVHSWDFLLYDAASRAAANAGQAIDDNVVVVALDETSLDQLSAPIALMQAELGLVLEALSVAGAKAVAVDLILPDQSFEHLLPGLDGKLIRGILSMRRAGPLVLARTVDSGGRSRPLSPAVVAAAGSAGAGFALFEADHDGVVRRFGERLGVADEMVPTLVGELARRLGHEPGAGLIDFTRPLTVPIVALHSVLAHINTRDHGAMVRDFSGKVVFIGLTLPFVDRHRVPAMRAPNTLPGVHAHVQAFRSIRDGRLLQESPGWINSALGAICVSIYLVSARLRYMLAFVVAGSVLLIAGGYSLMLAGWVLPVATLLTMMLAAASSRLAREMFLEIQARRRLRNVFAGYVSPHVMNELESGRLAGMASERRHIAVLFIDVRGFTSRSERNPPERVTATLNALFELVTASIHRHNGTVKEFMGDGVMSFFGAPQEIARPARAAYDAALEIHSALPGLNEKLQRADQEPLVVGMGLACGPAVVGHIGSPSRHTYGAMGDCVNVAARLETMTKELGYPLLLSGAAAAELNVGTLTISLGLHEVKGHSPVQIYGWKAEVAGGTQ